MEQKETAPDDERKKKALAASVAVFGTSLLLVGFAGPVLVRHFRSHLQALQLPATQNGSTNTRKNSLLSLTEAFRQPPSTIKFERNIDLDGRNIFAAGNQHLENQENADDAFDPGFYAAKALGIATAITLSVFGGGLATFAYKTGADSVCLLQASSTKNNYC